jgi:hypothetical protein
MGQFEKSLLWQFPAQDEITEAIYSFGVSRCCHPLVLSRLV